MSDDADLYRIESMRNSATRLYTQAARAHSAGDNALAISLLDQAVSTLAEIERLLHLQFMEAEVDQPSMERDRE